MTNDNRHDESGAQNGPESPNNQPTGKRYCPTPMADCPGDGFRGLSTCPFCGTGLLPTDDD